MTVAHTTSARYRRVQESLQPSMRHVADSGVNGDQATDRAIVLVKRHTLTYSFELRHESALNKNFFAALQSGVAAEALQDREIAGNPSVSDSLQEARKRFRSRAVQFI